MDDFTAGLKTPLCENGKINLWVTFASQLFLDIHSTLREDISRGFHELRTTAEKMERSVKQALHIHKACPWLDVKHPIFDSIFTQTQYLKQDLFQFAKSINGFPIGEPFFWLKQHPLVAGLFIYHLTALYQEASMMFVNNSGAIMFAGHLYNAVRQEKLLGIQWNVMEYLMLLHKNFFVGDRPTNAQDYCKRFRLACGASAVEFAKYKRKKEGVQLSKRGQMEFSILAPVFLTFIGRYCCIECTFELSTKDLERILTQNEGKIQKTPHQKQHTKCSHLLRKSISNEQGQRQSYARLTYRDLLEGIRSSLDSEVSKFSFDYLAVHRVCWVMLRAVDDRSPEILTAMQGLSYCNHEHEHHFSCLVSSILMSAGAIERLNSQLAKKKEPPVTCGLMKLTASIIHEHIQGASSALASEAGS